MKTRYFSFGLLFCVAAAFTACESDRDSNPVLDTSKTPEFVLNTPGFTNEAILLKNSNAMNFSWSQPTYGFTAETSYTLQMSVDGTFNDAVTDADGKEITPATYANIASSVEDVRTSVTAATIDKALMKICAWEDSTQLPAAPMELTIRCLANLKSSAVPTVVSNTVKMTVVPYFIETAFQYYYLVGALQGWSDGKRVCMLYPDTEDGLSTEKYSYTTKWEGDANMKIWYSDDFGAWDKAYGATADNSQADEGDLTNSGSGAIKCPTPGDYYTLTIDLGANKYKWTRLDNQDPASYENISLIGEFNGWGGDVDLSEITPHNWYGVFEQKEDGQLKFRANHDWSVNWGCGSDGDVDVSAQYAAKGLGNAGNIFVPAGTYNVFINDITGEFGFIIQKD